MVVRPEEWISKPDKNCDGFLKAWVVSGNEEFPIPIETHNVSFDDVTLGEEQDFDFIFECAEFPDVYPDEKAYENERKHSMASESVIPAGLFPLPNDEDFTPSPRIIMCGKVVKIYDDPIRYGFEEGDVLFSFTCFGNEYDAVICSDLDENIEIKVGNIVHCVYWVQGWPSED